MNWNDIRYLLAVSRGGTLSAAARRLGVAQTTVSRRLRALERDIGSRLFDHADGRLAPTPAGAEALARGARIEREILDLEHAVRGGNAALSGEIGITATRRLIADFLVPNLAAFRARHPEIFITFIGGSDNLSLSRREADIALRFARPRGGNLLARKLADMGYAIYGARELVARGRGEAPRAASPTPGDLSRLPWVAYDDSLAHLPEARWLAKTLPDVRPVMRSNGIDAQIAAVRAGLGVTLLPCYLADRDAGLIRLSGARPVLEREIWLLVHKDLRDTARIRAAIDWLADLMTRERRLFAGDARAHSTSGRSEPRG